MQTTAQTKTAQFIRETLEDIYYAEEGFAQELVSDCLRSDLLNTLAQDDFIPSNWRSYE